ncbi:hypothetical protein RDABS01_001310 [Bienertia sinuspersici]
MNDNRLPCLCIGDFNLLLNPSEKKGGGGFNFQEAEILQDLMTTCNLLDLGFIGHEFTWSNNRGGEEHIQERLDRCLVTQDWKELYPGASVSHLDKRKSDHLPLLVSIKGCPNSNPTEKRRKMFRFEAMWLNNDESTAVIEKAWRRGTDASINVRSTASALSSWSKQTFGNTNKELRECQKHMSTLMEKQQTKDVIEQMKMLDIRMDELERREEMFWHQRSRQNWLESGDKNTSFFHAKANQRRKRNNIEIIRGAVGNMFEKEEETAEVFTSYFEELFNSGSQIDSAPVINVMQNVIPESMTRIYEAPFNGEEIKEAIFQMHPTKAPGPDGMCALFFQRFWNIVGEDVIQKSLDFLNNEGDISAINRTHIVLIPKKKNCESPVDYRPISLCNVPL